MIECISSNNPLNSPISPPQKRLLDDVQTRTQAVGKDKIATSTDRKDPPKTARIWQVLTDIFHWILLKIQQVATFLFGKSSEFIPSNILPPIKWDKNSCYMDVVLWLVLANRDIFTNQIEAALVQGRNESPQDFKTRTDILQALNKFIAAAVERKSGEIEAARENLRQLVFNANFPEFPKKDNHGRDNTVNQQDSEAFLSLILGMLNRNVEMTKILQGKGADDHQLSITNEKALTIPLDIASFPPLRKEKDGSIDFSKLVKFSFEKKDNEKGHVWNNVPHFTQQFRLDIDQSSPPPYLVFQIKRGAADQEQNIEDVKANRADYKTVKLDTPIHMGPARHGFEMDFSDIISGSPSNTLDYELVASINHRGTSLNGGHYTIDIKQDKNASTEEHSPWLRADDLADDIPWYRHFNFNAKEAYILVYRYKGSRPLTSSSGDLRQPVSSTSSAQNLHDSGSPPESKSSSGRTTPRIEQS